MPTGSNSNGSGPSGSHPHRPSGSTPESAPVTSNGPFDLSEMERLANELFRELPGAVLPGLDAEQLAPVPPATEAETLRPAAGALPTPNGHVVSGSVPRHDPAAEGGGVVGSRPQAGGSAAPERFFYRVGARGQPCLIWGTGRGCVECFDVGGNGHCESLFRVGGERVALCTASRPERTNQADLPASTSQVG
jgi:hypothetical protein